MAHKGSHFQQVPTLRHTGYGGICAVIRRCKGQRRAIRLEYVRGLTRSSAARWIVAGNAGLCAVIRDGNLEVMQFLHTKNAAPAGGAPHEGR